MGWCSGTEIFDNVAKHILNSPLQEADQFDVLYELADVLEDHDWDCQQDSDYWDHHIVQEVMKKLHPDWDRKEL